MKVYRTDLYLKWITKLKDNKGKAIIRARLRRMHLSGNFRDFEKVSKSVYELKIDYGPGYRIYLTLRETKIIILLLGGDKSSQARDIKKAERMATSTRIEEKEEWY